MIITGLLFIPLVSAFLVWLLRGRLLRSILALSSLLHLALTIAALKSGSGAKVELFGVMLGFDGCREASLILTVTSVLFFCTALHLCFWLPAERCATLLRREKHGMSEVTFAALLLIFLATMTLTALAQDFGMLWVAVEATTLASAPLINFHRSKTSLEAMWKYLLLCSLGIGLALFGTMLLGASVSDGGSLTFNTINVNNLQWFKAAFVFCFAGYGLKTGLAPFHTWLPDAHSEAPAPVSALLSGSLLNCALLGLFRLRNAAPAELSGFCDGFFIFFGIFSLVIAAFFIIRQKDFKRMLAYSSVEHMGLIVLMAGFGCFDIMQSHIAFHSLIKMTLFLTAGNLLLAYGTRKIESVRGAFIRLPRNGILWMSGMLLICGTPPSPLFFTELVLIQRAGLLWGGMILLLLLIIFCAMAEPVIKMCTGNADKAEFPEIDRNAEKSAAIPLTVIAAVTVCGLITMRLIFCS